MIQQSFYKDFLFKKLKPKSEILEGLLESNEQHLVKLNEIPSLYNVSIPTQDDVWICGRIFSENVGGGGGKLTDHNVMIQGSYVCSNSHSISLNLNNCNEYSLFPGQIVLAHGRNPDGKRFICKQIIEPSFVSDSIKTKIKKEEIEKEENCQNSISIKLENDEDLSIIVASGPYMTNGTVNFSHLSLLMDIVKAKNVHVLILLGPFVDSNNELIANGNIQFTYEELLQNMLDEISAQLKNTKTRVIIQPSLNDLTQDPVYPVQPFNISTQYLKQNEFFHFVPEPNMIKINNTLFAITTTDAIKDIISTSICKTNSSDKISRNFAHLLRQQSFYPIYPPPDHVCIDYEAWNKYARISSHPKVFIAVSDLATFNKEVNNCICLNPGRLVKGTSSGTYAQIILPSLNKLNSIHESPKKTQNTSNICVSFHKI